MNNKQTTIIFKLIRKTNVLQLRIIFLLLLFIGLFSSIREIRNIIVMGVAAENCGMVRTTENNNNNY